MEEQEEEEEQGYEEEGVMGYVDYFASMSHLTCTGHDRFPFAQPCVCACSCVITRFVHKKLWATNK